MSARAVAMVPHHVDEPLASVVVVKERGVEAARIDVDRVRPRALDRRRGHDVVVRVLEVAVQPLDVGIDQPEFAVGMGQAWRPDAAGIGFAAQVELGGALERPPHEPPIDEIARVVDLHARIPFEGRGGDVIVVARAADRRVGIEAGRIGLRMRIEAPQRAAQSMPRSRIVLHLRHVELGRDMAERTVEDAARAMPALPHDRHDDALGPRRVLAGKRRRRKHLVRRVDMHVILLGTIGEARDSLHDRVVGLRDVDPVVDYAAGVGDPLTAAHELVVDAVAKRVAHAAVIAGETDAALHRRGQVLHLFLFDLRHRDDRHDQAHVGDRGIGEGLGRVFDVDLEVMSLQHLGDDVRALLRLVAAPASPDDESFPHRFLR